MIRTNSAMAILVAGALSVGGCGVVEPCVEERKVWDSTLSLGYDIYQLSLKNRQQLVRQYESEGWKCSDEELYNAFGNRFGRRFTCVRC